jgi:hypothetical protein
VRFIPRAVATRRIRRKAEGQLVRQAAATVAGGRRSRSSGVIIPAIPWYVAAVQTTFRVLDAAIIIVYL